MKLWYRQPATQWIEALPIGNGSTGAMIYGGVQEERLQLNNDTLWSGGRRDWNNPGARDILPEVRRLIDAERYAEADALTRQMQGPFTQAYLPLGELGLIFPHQQVTHYHRELDLDHAVASVEYRTDGAQFTRRMFASYPHDVIVVRLTCDRPGYLNLRAILNSPLRHTTTEHDHTLMLCGQAPSNVWPDYYPVAQPITYDENAATLHFCAYLRVVAEGGQVSADAHGINIDAADAVTLYLATATSFYHAERSPETEARATLANALEAGHDDILEAHTRDYQHLYNRVTLDLGTSAEQPTDTLLKEQSPSLIPLLFQYGRYLLIASSRPGTQAANLQGIWNPWLRPPWGSNYTLNINTQMNYWPAEPAALPECHEPLFDLIELLSDTGRETARINYGANGWTAHHNTDLWGQSAPPGNYGDFEPIWTMWPLGGAWLCQHLWEHYAYTGDRDFLANRAYPIMKEATRFCLDWLVERDGKLITSPSTSPENMFSLPDGSSAAVSAATTMDMAIIWDLFTNCIEAAEILDVDEDFRRRLSAARARLYPPQVGRHGQLQEWAADWDRPDDQHRHISHAFGLHPGRQITHAHTPDLFAAIKKSIEMRGDEGTGWSLAWKVNLWARLHDGNHALSLLRRMLRLIEDAHQVTERGGVYANLLDAHPPFQIDGNFGVVAGIIEMLVQSHTGIIHLLPALPDAWPSGAIRGVRVRGGYTLNLHWADHKPVAVEISAKYSGICRIYAGSGLMIEGGTVDADGVLSFPVEAGQTYHLG